MQADHPLRRALAPIQVCSVQTLTKRELPKVEFVMVDESHVEKRISDPLSHHGEAIGWKPLETKLSRAQHFRAPLSAFACSRLFHSPKPRQAPIRRPL